MGLYVAYPPRRMRQSGFGSTMDTPRGRQATAKGLRSEEVSYITSFIAQSYHGIYADGAAGWDVACE